MFNIGDNVRHVARNVVGVVIDIDGDTVYLEQPNGCEVDFAASALIYESDFQARHDTSVQDDAGSHAHDAAYDAVLDSMYPAIIDMGQLLHSQAERIPGVAAKRWEELSSLQKINAISAATEVPVKTWIDSSQPGARPAIGTVQLTVLQKNSK
ncbi:MAG: hypothetical protein HN658_04490 [Rhodospirillales bacterium]|jgi:hypothetical protein|nr:hypothetical protein [Rhodospirillales bacterium]MBT4005651.1 hypothetical protein [Rhodospirillales bacterium]MBT5075851.1 hypothetical protein [Rhodospirillales bacterium]MBT5113306.1 hypothetical protein [Rhodospirillales bacterium]MBT5672132.1 hypothetical protein [Rhodospirillales bacterium]